MINEVDVVDMCDKPNANPVQRVYTLSYQDGYNEVKMTIPGDRFVTEMMEEFEKFLRATGHRIPINCHIGFTDDAFVTEDDWK